jgi:SAM-dependent methyltransferase
MRRADDPATLFRRSWSLYDAITAENFMFHRELYGQVASILAARHRRGPDSVLDLGCGNARFLAPCLAGAPPVSYVGVDLSPTALAEAREYLAGVENVSLHEQDMTVFAADWDGICGVIFTGYAVHHLPNESKGDLFRAGAVRLQRGGELLMIDVLRDDGEDRDGYIERYLRLMREEWTTIPRAMIEEACDHVAAHDQPASLAELRDLASAAGFANVEVIERHGPHHLLRFSEVAG